MSETPRCNCRKCLDERDERNASGWPIASTMFIVCPSCGNKRCPHASDHDFLCTNSNEPGQTGSVFPGEVAKAKPAPSETPEMVERAARAILKARFYDYEPEAYGKSLETFFAEIDEDHVEQAQYEARAAIDAMREPELLMVQAACDATFGPIPLSPEAAHMNGWRAMIDAALTSSTA